MIYGYNPFLVYTVDLSTGVLQETSKTFSDANEIWGMESWWRFVGGLHRSGVGCSASDQSADSTAGPSYLTFFHSSRREAEYVDIGNMKDVKQYDVPIPDCYV